MPNYSKLEFSEKKAMKESRPISYLKKRKLKNISDH